MEGSEPPNSAVVLGEAGAEMLEKACEEIGLICNACGLMMDGSGFEFVKLVPVFSEGQPVVNRGKVFVCGREHCAEHRERARLASTAYRPAGGWTFLESLTIEHDDDEEPASDGS